MLAHLVLVVSLSAGPRVVAPEWNGVNVKHELLVFYAGALAEELRKNGLDVVTQQDVSTILGIERQKQLLGCSDAASECMAELANALGCDATLVVNLARFEDGGFSGLAKLLSSRDGATLSSAKLDASSERGLLEALERAAELLAAPLKPDAVPVAVTASRPWTPKRLWWAPGAVGLVGVGAGVGLLVVARQTYDGLAAQPTLDAARAEAGRGQSLQTGGFVALGVGAAALATAVVFLVWPDAPVTPVAAFAPGNGVFGVQGVF